jgi:hypothetical protein
MRHRVNVCATAGYSTDSSTYTLIHVEGTSSTVSTSGSLDMYYEVLLTSGHDIEVGFNPSRVSPDRESTP